MIRRALLRIFLRSAQVFCAAAGLTTLAAFLGLALTSVAVATGVAEQVMHPAFVVAAIAALSVGVGAFIAWGERV